MNLLDLKDPKQIKDMNYDELNQLCLDIRNFLIESVSKTGGHLSSNLGVVELTVALHYIFNSPNDKLIFDVGHQCYAHKILTGRSDKFSSLRTYNGLSGFIKRKESEHDIWEAGHASTSLSAALGMAIARDLDHQDHDVVAIIGDGALTGGMAFEALNHIGATDHKVIIILNDNNMSISPNVGAVNKMFEKLRQSKPYTSLKKDVKGVLKTSGVGESILSGMQNVKDLLKKNLIDDSIFGEFGLNYFGPVNGHDIKEMINIFKLAKEQEESVVIHIMTNKGKGFSLCEEDRHGYWHGVGSFDPNTGISLTKLPNEYMPWAQIVSETLIRLAKDDRQIVGLTPAMINGSKLEKFFALFPNRAFDCGIAEEHAATLAAGLAVAGKKPFLAIYSTFLQRAYDQINHDICRMDLPVVIGIDHSQLVGEDGETHHGIFDIGILQPLPNIIIAHPKDAIETQNMLYTAFEQKHPFAIRYNKNSIEYQENDHFEHIKIGSWELFNHTSTTKAFIITYGYECTKLIDKIKNNNLDIAIVNARFIKPIDHDMLDKISAFEKPIVTYEIDMLNGGLSSSIINYYNDKQGSVNIFRFGIGDLYVQHGSNVELKKGLKLDTNSFIDSVIKIIEDNEN
ncbi:MAG: 1-deoxy-D-xylulose-5-phosphate synthase [Erysipelotrichaceae bacterium]|nr:1-deoxy-D-xylulose-5-phosphate synthase [Erysipelotrichaceae bacterium]MDD4643364.1 1-deoxy-D-xylulose-5-phosphate synthase [Erysipelotrichaceae bacterium]